MSIGGGPYVQAAFFCQNVIQETNGLLSIVQIIDGITNFVVGPKPDGASPPFQFQAKLVILLKSGPLRGEREIRVVQEAPDGTPQAIASIRVPFGGDDEGVNYISNFTGTYHVEGLYWYNIYVEDELATAIPFSVNYPYSAAS